MKAERAILRWLWLLPVLGLVGGAIYFAALLRLSATSEKTHLIAGEQKSFGFFDPHLHGTLVDVRVSRTWGEPPRQITADGVFYLVTVRVWNDAVGAFTVDPSFLTVALLDAQENHYPPVEVQAAARDAPVTRLAGELSGGESYEAAFLFDVPETVSDPALWIADTHWITRFIPGHENSFLHRKVVFELE